MRMRHLSVRNFRGIRELDWPIPDKNVLCLIGRDAGIQRRRWAGVAAAREPHRIAEVMDWARRRIATPSGVRMEAVKLDCRIET